MNLKEDNRGRYEGIEDLLAYIDLVAIPAAIEAGLLPVGTTRGGLVGGLVGESDSEQVRVPAKGNMPLVKRKEAFSSMVALVADAPEMAAELGDDFVRVLDILQRHIYEFAGFCEGLSFARQRQTSAAVGGRKQLGKKSREQVRLEASAYAGKLTREQAAQRIAERVFLGPARVRRLLSEIFPGKEWSHSARIDDATGGNGNTASDHDDSA